MPPNFHNHTSKLSDRNQAWAHYKPCDPEELDGYSKLTFHCPARCSSCQQMLHSVNHEENLFAHIQKNHSTTQIDIEGANQEEAEDDNNDTVGVELSSSPHKTKSSPQVPESRENKSSLPNMTALINASKTYRKDTNFLPNSGHVGTKKISSNRSKIGLELSKYESNNIHSKTSSDGSVESLGWYFISRLNELSAPVRRKLKFWNKKSVELNQYDPTFKVIYLGNLGVQLLSKDESCLVKPLSTLWNNYLVHMKTEIGMRLTICNSGLKAITRQHGLTQYWSNRLVFCCNHKNYPRIFTWIYRHEGKKMRQEIRCHAVLCSSPERASKMVTLLNERLACALEEFRREKKSPSSSSGFSRDPLSIYNTVPRAVPLRRQILAKGSTNFRPPLERTKSAPKLTPIIEDPNEPDSFPDEFKFVESFSEFDDRENVDINSLYGHAGQSESHSVEELASDDEFRNLKSESCAAHLDEELVYPENMATGDINNKRIIVPKSSTIEEDLKDGDSSKEMNNDIGGQGRLIISTISKKYNATPSSSNSIGIEPLVIGEKDDKIQISICHDEIESSIKTKDIKNGIATEDEDNFCNSSNNMTPAGRASTVSSDYEDTVYKSLIVCPGD